MKSLLVLLVLGICLCYSPALAWQDPCLIIESDYVYEEYTLTGWASTTSLFSPAPRCEGTVLLINSDSTWTSLDYRSSGDKFLIAGIPCWLNNDGDLVCKIITQPEESETFIFEERE